MASGAERSVLPPPGVPARLPGAASSGRDRRGAGGRRSKLKRWSRRFGLGRALAIIVLLALVALRVWDPPPVEAVRLRTFDAYQVTKPRVPLPQRPVQIVDIDEASLREFGQWPWPRTRVADLIRRLTAAGAVVIGFDIVFAEPDRMSPNLLADALPTLDPATQTTLRALPSNDAVMADAMRASRVILGQTALAAPVPWEGGDLPPTTNVGIRAVAGASAKGFVPEFAGLLRNTPTLEAAAIGRGLFTILPEQDGIVRRVPMIVEADGMLMPTLSLEILRVLTGSPGIVAQADQGGLAGIILPGLELPTDPFGKIWVHFAPHDPGKFTSARDVLSGGFPPGRFTNKIVLVGTSAVGLLDNKTTPLDRSMPGVEVHSQLLESALSRSTLVAPNYAPIIEMLVAVAVSVAIILFAPILGAVNLLLFGASVAAFLVYASWHRYSQSGILLDATFPLAASFSVYLTLVFTNYLREQAGRARIRSAFSQYLSPALVEQLAQSPEKLRLGGEERTLTIMFSDVRGFTAISEFYKNDPPGLTALMNRFLTPLTNAILDRKGTIDKYMGDAIMAFWNAPLDDPNQEHNSCAAALEMLARMNALNALRKTEAESGGHPVLPLDVGIGLNTGRCVVGNMGSDLRFDYSVLGDTVNLASRLESQSKNYGIKIIMGSTTALAVQDTYPVVEIDLIRVKGKTEPEAIYTLVGDRGVRTSAEFDELARRHREMITAYRAQDWDMAMKRALACRSLAEPYGIEALYRLYLERIAAFQVAPPGPDWVGVYVAETK